MAPISFDISKYASLPFIESIMKRFVLSKHHNLLPRSITTCSSCNIGIIATIAILITILLTGLLLYYLLRRRFQNSHRSQDHHPQAPTAPSCTSPFSNEKLSREIFLTPPPPYELPAVDLGFQEFDFDFPAEHVEVVGEKSQYLQVPPVTYKGAGWKAGTGSASRLGSRIKRRSLIAARRSFVVYQSALPLSGFANSGGGNGGGRESGGGLPRSRLSWRLGGWNGRVDGSVAVVKGDGEGESAKVDDGADILRMSSVKSEGVARSVKVLRVAGKAKVESLSKDKKENVTEMRSSSDQETGDLADGRDEKEWI